MTSETVMPPAPSAALVGPVPTMRMRDGTVLTVDVPKDTRDPRYVLCGAHRTGCDCYEAERNEQLAELRGELKAVSRAVADILAGHRTRSESHRVTSAVWTADPFVDGSGAQLIRDYEYDPDAVCSCTGCQIARAAWLR